MNRRWALLILFLLPAALGLDAFHLRGHGLSERALAVEACGGPSEGLGPCGQVHIHACVPEGGGDCLICLWQKMGKTAPPAVGAVQPAAEVSHHAPGPAGRAGRAVVLACSPRAPPSV